MQPAGIWWIFSENEDYGGLRIATFFEQDGHVYVIVQGEPIGRMGIREWSILEKFEGFFKVKEIDKPTADEVWSASARRKMDEAKTQAQAQHDGPV